VFAATVAMAFRVDAQEVTIEAFHGNGSLTWQSPTNADCTIEWASRLTPTTKWSHSWIELINTHCTNGSATSDVPMFYRISAWTNGLFFRMPIGRTYRYACTNSAGRTWTGTVLCGGVVSVASNGHDYILLPKTHGYSEPRPAGCDPNGMMMFRSTGHEVYVLSGAAEEMLFWQNAPVGTIWTNAMGTNVVEAIGDVTVPAGIFTGCVKIRHLSDNSYEWVKPGFFMVKAVYLLGDVDGPASTSLESWSDK